MKESVNMQLFPTVGGLPLQNYCGKHMSPLSVRSAARDKLIYVRTHTSVHMGLDLEIHDTVVIYAWHFHIL